MEFHFNAMLDINSQMRKDKCFSGDTSLLSKFLDVLRLREKIPKQWGILMMYAGFFYFLVHYGCCLNQILALDLGFSN